MKVIAVQYIITLEMYSSDFQFLAIRILKEPSFAFEFICIA
jgi:hypothetical protein